MSEGPLPVWPMRPLLQTASGSPITERSQWQSRAEAIRKVFFKTLGPTPPTQYLRSFETDAPIREGNVQRTLMRITVDDDDVMQAWLLEPIDGNIQGVAVAPHGTNEHGKDYVAGTADVEHAPYALELAQRGWVVLAPDCHALCNRFARGLDAYDTAAFYERFPQWSSVGKIIVDLRACVDVLVQLPQTKGHPISAIGHSLGGQSALYIAAADERIAACVCNCGIYPFADSDARAHWFREQWYIYLQDPDLKRSVIEGPQPLWDFHELAALVAPRRLLLSMSPNDYCCGHIEGITQMTADLHRVWSLHDAQCKLTCIIHNDGHAFERRHRTFAYEWLQAAGEPKPSGLRSSTEAHNPNQ